ncbi:calponin-1-like [Octopus sinensis]|uniref:Calponin-1-like n=1 Tax=Octopus sinensis TaxID=2607531 RepID=A0A6P7T8Y2_9MOLL|nr:calponin-1-like [Octopus sinensis]
MSKKSPILPSTIVSAKTTGNVLSSYMPQPAQRHNFSGPQCGPKPHESREVRFNPEVMRAGEGIIGLQAGTNKFATQKGMVIGGVRHVADIRCDKYDPESCKDINLQSGTNKFATQKGIVIGGVRHIADIRCDDFIQDSQGHVGLQSGSNKFATQKGMSFGAVRHVNDIKSDEITDEGKRTINLQYGFTTGANQSGMSFGKNRSILL